MITVNSRKYDGAIRRSWKCEIVHRSDDHVIAVGHFEAEVDHPDLGLIAKGTVSREYFWTNRWYNIFKFTEPDGTFRNYYCNICMPPEITDDAIDYVDLDIDVLVNADFSYRILDRDDFEASAAIYGYPAELRAKVESTLLEILDLIGSRDLPDAAEISGTFENGFA